MPAAYTRRHLAAVVLPIDAGICQTGAGKGVHLNEEENT